MKKDVLTKKVLCSLLLAGTVGISNMAFANSGGHINGYGNYVGDSVSDSNVAIDSNFTGDVYGNDYDNTSGTASNNTVTVTGVVVDGAVYGAYAYGKATTDNNKVNIINSTVNGGIVGSLGMGFVDNSKVIVTNSVIKSGNIGFANDAAIVGGFISGNQSLTDNYVEINDSVIVGKIYAVYTHSLDTSTITNVDNNVIKVTGNSDLSNASIYGDDDGSGKGSKLIIDGWSGNVKSINNFNAIEVESLAGGLNLQAGEKTNFVTTTESDSIGGTIDNAEVTDMKAGVALEVDGTLKIDGGNIGIEVANVKVQKQTAITTETRAAAAAFVNQGAEVVADNLNMLSHSQEGINTFATVSGNNSKYKTGSYVDINGWNTVIGIANTKEAGKDKINYGAFFENGSGNYNTFNEFDGNALRGDGNVVYNGGGVILRLDKENGFYTEAAVRAGSVKNEVGNALADTNGKTYGFETENAYYGGHIGIGKVFKLDNGKTWDVYGKYFHMHQEGDSVLIGKDRFEFDSVDSNKLRIGARFTEKQGEKLTSYYGLAWDYEFSGDVGGTANQHAMYTPSLEGSTVIGEIGFRYTPGKESPWYFDANVKGYVGMQEGLSGSVQAVYSF
jgi:hypothetical protein